MTAASLALLPVAAGGVVLASAGRVSLWAMARYMRAPLANTGILAMLTLSAMAGSNALYLQQHEHPAPLFAPVVREASLKHEILPVIPATRKKPVQVIAPLASEETTGSVDAQAEPAAIGNAEVGEIQRKLQSMQIYEGAIDGLYGPRTARAIRAFEERMGLKPKGELTWELLEAVRTAPVILPEPEIVPLPTPDPLPEVTVPTVKALPSAEAEPLVDAPENAEILQAVEAALAPLPAPEPLEVELEQAIAAETEPATATRPVVHRELPETPQEAMNIAVETAGDAIDTIISGVQAMTKRTPGKKEVDPVTFLPEDQTLAAVAEAEPAIDTIETASIDAPQVGVPLADPDAEVADVPTEEVAVLDTDARPEDLMPVFSVTDPVIVAKVQRGLASLGFLYGPADGVAGEATAKAIRNFEVYYNYKVTGRISPELLDLLVQNGASI